MKISFSSHAEKRLKERGIKKEAVIETVEFPEYTIKRSNNEIEAYKKLNGKMLKVVYFQKENYIKVITLYYIS
tara:strand:- start:2204 stop:2422 length:219 start_codon:yes stop_codon:yes gene_type:complete